jgi:fibro-slime domain-containing protein/LPXTG-motif cell wall-anchored protein
VLPSSQRERRVSRLNRTGKNTTGWARRLTALLVTACLVMAMALPVYAEVDLLPDAPDEVELLEDEQGTASGEDTVPPEQNAATPVPDAVTPEPEQSAEPEQPAPTETPEPTAEPTPTPEPAATATATPVPTVTPTATPEPTEQPQKMYAATSVDNVQAVSEPEATDGFTVYFVVPDTMPGNNETVTVLDSDEIKFNVRTDRKPGNSKNDEWWLQLSMEPTGWKTEDGHKIYAVKNCKDILGDNFLEIQFQLYRDGGWTAQITLKEQEPKPINFYNNKMYDPTKNADPTKGEWTDDSILTSHTYYANKPIKFENRSTANLTNVKANFYIPDEKSGNLTLVNGDAAAQNVPEGEFVSFTIPEQACSYVQFTWDEDGEEKSSKFYNFYNESVSGNDKESFMYSETSNCFIYTGADNVRWGRENSFRIYYDATFSKLPTTGTGDTSGNYSIPKANNSETIYYRIKGGNGNSEKGTLVKDDTNENLYYVDIPQEYSSNSSIIFSGEEINDDNATKGNGVSTAWLPIPTDDKNCFYADTNDDAVYKGTTRGGYWAPKGTLRDAETWKNTDTTDTTKTKVVDIASVPFTEKPNTKYVTSTLYDYYTDYELNGNNRGSYDQSSPTVSHRNWVPFRQFDQALSDYYKDAKAQYPIYTGHFQPDSGTEFSQIASTLNLFGYDNEQSKFNHFMAINNSQRNDDNTNGSNHTNYAYQGLVANTTSTGKATGEPLLKGTGAVEPHFNKEFLLGKNSKNAKLGEVYDNVAFPFTKKQIFGEDQGVDYWCFDSKDTTLYLKQNSEQNSDSKYFLQSQSANNRESSKNVSASSNPKDPYGYFPFNETAKPGVFSTYNYGFGTKLQMDFTLTDDGMVETEKADGTTEKTSIKFFFSGDDDVWVFIDGQLALDVGGAHGEVSGLLEFGKADEKNNSVTAYVSRVKTGGTSDKDKDEKNVKSAVKTVTYNGEVINFYAQGTTLNDLDKGKKHTLTMYYMERGMWESNMAVAFNFPDNNELQVQKEVDLTNVTDDDFKNCFKNQKIFNFTIQNQATHYGKTDAVGPNESGTQSQKVNLNESNIAAATPGNEYDYIFRRETNPWPDSGNENEQVLHWYARFTDTQSAAREKRRGILTLENPINIKDMRFLTFQVYVDPKDHGGDLSLNNLYLELLDENNVQKGSLGTTGINGATYGSVEVKTGAWVTVKLDLHKMKEQGGFNNNVKTIRVGDNYNRNIYFRDFTFIPKAVPSKMTGFTTDQKEIPDYGSAESGHLENAENAQYTSSNDTDTQLVDKDGRFVLEAGETVTFSDQFRRGSYISLKEELNQNLYDTTWTVCENGHVVESMKEGNSVTLPSTIPSLDGQTGSSPNDGRTEKKGADKEQEGNKYNENKPSADTIVFRSYKDPDENSSTLTKLKVKYVNTVKTGGLKIQKKAAEGEEGTINGTYTFKVTFNDVGGEGLEKKDIIKYVEINMSDENNSEHTGTITGIPVGTRYTIEEVKTDDSRLQSVTVPDGQYAHVIDNTMVEGEIVASKNPNDPNDLEVTAVFTNTKRKLINIEFDKLWKDANDTALGTTNQPNEIYIQLQRKNSAADAKWEVVDYPTSGSKYVTVHHTDNGWLYPFNNLDQYPVGGSADNNYIYRIVEGTVDDKGSFTPAAEDGTITINGNTYVVTAEATAKSEKDSETGATTTPAKVNGGTITGGSGKIELTNKLQNPKFVLDIIKKDAEKGENDKEVPLGGVEFKLEKLKAETTGGEPQVDTTYEFNDTNTGSITTGSITATTDGSGKITNMFTNLEPGTYRLTETKAHPGYNLLAQPIEIRFTQDGKCYIDDVEVKKDGNTFKDGPNNTYTMTLTVLNRKTPELPHTGADAPSLWLLIGMPLAVAGLLIFTFRYNRKGGRRH